MDNMLEVIDNIENGQSVTISNKEFDKKMLDDLVTDIDKSKELFPDNECQMLIQTYAVHKRSKDHYDITSSAILRTFVIGFGIGVLIAGIIAMIEQYLISR